MGLMPFNRTDEKDIRSEFVQARVVELPGGKTGVELLFAPAGDPDAYGTAEEAAGAMARMWSMTLSPACVGRMLVWAKWMVEESAGEPWPLAERWEAS